MRAFRVVGLIVASGCMVLLPLAGCGDDDATATPGVDGGTDVAAPDAGPGLDAQQPDTSTGDAADASGPAPKIVPISLTGHDRLFGVTFDAAGNIYATGVTSASTDASEDYESIVAKLTPAGVLDTTFGTNGVAKVNLAVGANGEVARGIVVQSTGKIVIAGEAEHVGAADARDRDIYLARFDATGALDMGFGTNGVVTLDLSDGEVNGAGYVRDTHWGLTLLPGDGLLVSGASKRPGATDLDYALVKTDADGVLDGNFGTGGVFTLDLANTSASPRNAVVLADGSIVGCGYYTEGVAPSTVVKPVMFKVTSAGVLDPTFGTGGVYTETVLAMVTEIYGAAAQGTSFVTAGYGRETGTTNDWVSLRIKSDGTRDMTYGTGGLAKIDLATFNDNARAVAVLPGDRVMLVGAGRTSATEANAMIAVLGKDGQPDLTFGAKGLRTYDLGGPGDFFWGVAVSPDKKKVVAVGLYGASPDAGAGNTDDDAAILILPLP